MRFLFFFFFLIQRGDIEGSHVKKGIVAQASGIHVATFRLHESFIGKTRGLHEAFRNAKKRHPLHSWLSSRSAKQTVCS